MQTFLPHPDFSRSMACLDYRRLGKQRVEAKQIYLALTVPAYGWRNHPAVKMWRGYEEALAAYGVACCTAWRSRGYRDTLLGWFAERARPSASFPPWVGNSAFHLSHQSNLIRKSPGHYSPLFPGVSPDLPYVWPNP